MALLVGPGAGRADAALPALPGRGARWSSSIALRRAPQAAAVRAGVAASRSARSGWPPSGAGRTSGCRCRGRPRCCPRARCSGFAMAIAGALRRRAGSARGWPPTARRAPPLRAAPWSARWRSSRWSASALLTTGRQGVRGDRRADDVAGAGARERDGPRRPARRRRRRRVAHRDRRGRAAGWSSTGCSASAPGVYRDDRADPGRRRLEDDDPPAPRQRADRAAGLPARRPGDPGEGRAGHADFTREFVAEQKLLQRERKTAAGWLWAPPTGSCWRSRWRSSCCWPGACTGRRRPPSRRATTSCRGHPAGSRVSYVTRLCIPVLRFGPPIVVAWKQHAASPALSTRRSWSCSVCSSRRCIPAIATGCLSFRSGSSEARSRSGGRPLQPGRVTSTTFAGSGSRPPAPGCSRRTGRRARSPLRARPRSPPAR